MVQGTRLYRRADGNRRIRACAKRLWTADHYRLSEMRERQAHWMKEEPPRIYAGECQIRMGVRAGGVSIDEKQVNRQLHKQAVHIW